MPTKTITIEKLTIKRIHKVDDTLITQINTLVDRGNEWNIEEGRKFITNKDNVLFVAYVDDVAAGFLIAYRLQRFDRRKAEVLLYEVGTHNDFRKKGVGKKLIEETKVWAKEVGANEMWVLTNRSNIPATALYASTGGVQTKTLDDTMFVYGL